MKVTVDIGPYWPEGPNGEPLSINAAHTRIKTETPNLIITRMTLEKALGGRSGANLVTLVKLARICSAWVGTNVSVDDLISVEED